MKLVHVLDCEALSRAVNGDPLMGARIKAAQQQGVRVITSSMTLVESYHKKINRPLWQWMLSRIIVEPVTAEIANEAIALLADAGLHGHKYAIDSALAAIALRQRGAVTIFTSDPDDMIMLCGSRAEIVRV
ncbi:PIN domain-containing protein [Kitasatospora sp. NPDC093806]|uniref:PIN domain-containing protein n=1 Tax=Kitasatospora sp. NPDC093806 TaxID=3155075 RepID=UPI00344A7F13